MSRSGPLLKIVASCHGCDHILTVRSTSEHHGYQTCGHPKAPAMNSLENTHTDNSTPRWCPVIDPGLLSAKEMKKIVSDLMATFENRKKG